MKFQGGERVCVKHQGVLRMGIITAVNVEKGSYTVSVGPSYYGFHEFQEVDVQAYEDVDPNTIELVPGKVPSWYDRPWGGENNGA